MSLEMLTTALRAVERNPHPIILLKILTEHPFTPSSDEYREAERAFTLIMRIARECNVSYKRAPMALDMTTDTLNQMAEGTCVPSHYKMIAIITWIKREMALLARIKAA